MQVVCHDMRCILGHVEAQKARKLERQGRQKRKEIREQKERLKTKAQHRKEAQCAVNAYRRELFKGEPCISCGRHHRGQYHAGHYMSRGAHPELALVEENIWKQCQPCNVHLSGNLLNFRAALIKRVGVEFVEWLEGPHEPVKHTVEDYKRIKAEYRKKLRELKKARDEENKSALG